MHGEWQGTLSVDQLLQLALYPIAALCIMVFALRRLSKEADQARKERQEKDKFEAQMQRLEWLRAFAEERLESGHYPFDNRLGLMSMVGTLYYLEATYRELGAKAVDEKFEYGLEVAVPILRRHLLNLTSESTRSEPILVRETEHKKAG